MRNTYLSAAALALMAASAPSMAAPGFEPGMYIDIDLGRASVSSNKYFDNSNELSLGGNVGYQFTPNFGFEVYSRSLHFNPFRSLGAPLGYYPERHDGIAALGTVPLDAHFSLFGRAGIGRTVIKSTRTSIPDRTDTDPVVGLGVRYAFNRSFSLSLEGTYLSKSEVSLISFGARYQF
ncbi:outer membrane beta-barrel protein [Rugamonas aquatica]|uniref:Outer membrane beta-barrel protein n=1 Tax=Rugamonas aquatica TaxID=2743357 RepID=A0A6A7NCT5_9BURK|nr:outer membrane beta-barrel protein [Rugamonas aquatica]MQA42864.1 outer membrane beta-barrel protein [Rugamonas aquatica]